MRRRNLVVWNQSAASYPASRVTRPVRPVRPVRAGQIRRRVRLVLLLAAVGVQRHWRPLAGVVLIGAGLAHRGGWPGLVLLPGLLLVLSAPLIPATPRAERLRRSALERELAAFTTTRQRFDLLATLDQYPDGVTYELRDILARQAISAANPRIPGSG